MTRQLLLKEVSKAKLQILEKYFPSWARILGSRHPTLVYVDCFAGAGKYLGGEEGSPLVVLSKAQEMVRRSKHPLNIVTIFVEKDATAVQELQANISKTLPDLPKEVRYYVFNEDAHDFVEKLLEVIPNGVPAFFFVDPYGHPLTIPVMNKILERQRTEILLTLMWCAINRHLNNPKTVKAITRMFGHDEWRNQTFIQAERYERETQFLDYFLLHLNAEYKLRFRILFSPEDSVPGGEHRTKYYLVHLSNHPKAVLLMKEVMWRLGDEMGTFEFSARPQLRLFSQTPQVDELIKYLKQEYRGSGRTLTFGELREETWELPFIESYYREAVKQLENEGAVQVVRVKSKKTGISDEEILCFKRED